MLCFVCTVSVKYHDRRSCGLKLPMKNWNKATDILKDHQKEEYHITASLRADDFLQTAERPETSITPIIDNEAARHIAKNRKLLRSIISCIVFVEHKISLYEDTMSRCRTKEIIPVTVWPFLKSELRQVMMFSPSI